MKPFNVTNVIVSILTLISVVIDFCITNELHLENAFLFVVVVVLLFNTIRQLNPKLWAKAIPGILSDLLLLGLSLYGFAILALAGFGYGFTGRSTPSIWIVLTLCHLLLSVLTVGDIIYLRKRPM